MQRPSKMPFSAKILFLETYPFSESILLIHIISIINKTQRSLRNEEEKHHRETYTITIRQYSYLVFNHEEHGEKIFSDI